MSATINASMPFASPLVLAERLIALAIDADQSGFSAAARRLVATAHSVLDRPGAAPSSRPTPSSDWPRTEELQASMVAVGLLPAQTATIHTPRFGADSQRGTRSLGSADPERFAISRLAAR